MQENNVDRNSQYEGLQVGRGIAALAVVIFHAKMILIRFPDDYIMFPLLGTHGYYGVQFFFVISGFIIFHVISKASFSPGTFIIKRFFRLWPLYAVATLTYVAVYLIQRNIAAGELGYTFPALLKALVFWPQGKYPLLNPGWSLEHEVIYYAYAAIVCGLAGPRVFFCFLIANCLLGQVVLNLLPYFGVRLIAWDYHLISSLNTYFLIGSCVFVIKNKIGRLGVLWPLVAGSASIVVGAFILGEMADQNLKRMAEIAWVGTGCGLILVGLLNTDGVYEGRQVEWLSALFRFFRWLGDRSYSLYLFHFVWICVFQLVHRDYVRWPEYAAEPLCVLFVVLSIFTAAFTYRLLEVPSSEYGAKVARKMEGARALGTWLIQKPLGQNR